MLGDQISELKGKVQGQRVIDVRGPTLETTVEAKGMYKGVEVSETLTFIGSPISGTVFHGEGKGIIRTAGGEFATYEGKGIGIIKTSGAISWRGSLFFNTMSNGELKFLGNLVGVFEVDIDHQVNFLAWNAYLITSRISFCDRCERVLMLIPFNRATSRNSFPKSAASDFSPIVFSIGLLTLYTAISSFGRIEADKSLTGRRA